MSIKTSWAAAAGLALAFGGLAILALAADKPADAKLARGKYLVEITGCNDCHTPGFGLSGGKVPESEWLVGDGLGWQGPWGTTYASNLRLYFKDKTEAQWLKEARTLRARPPMPYWAVNTMTDDDLRAIFRYVKSLPPKGAPAPAYVPPGQPAKGPVVAFPSPPPGK